MATTIVTGTMAQQVIMIKNFCDIRNKKQMHVQLIEKQRERHHENGSDDNDDYYAERETRKHNVKKTANEKTDWEKDVVNNGNPCHQNWAHIHENGFNVLRKKQLKG